MPVGNSLDTTYLNQQACPCSGCPCAEICSSDEMVCADYYAWVASDWKRRALRKGVSLVKIPTKRYYERAMTC
jgi:hypothetical protein